MAGTGRRGRPRKSQPASTKSQDDADAQSTNPTARQHRITPRNSVADEAIATAAAKETPYADLRALAGAIVKPTTPLQRPPGTGPASNRRATRQTPLNLAGTPGSGPPARAASTRRPLPATPHGRNARRTLQRRAQAPTPARDRRRSGRLQRDTPQDALKTLSRVLAPGTERIQTSPITQSPASRRTTLGDVDDFEQEEDPPRPSLSIPIEDEDDDSLVQPPRLSSVPLDEENLTQQSVELPRRAISEQPGRQGLSRASFGSIRMSDRFADLNDLSFAGTLDDGIDTSGLRPEYDDEIYGNEDGMEIDPELIAEDTQNLRRILQEESARRQSEIRPEVISADEDETTFRFALSGRNLQEAPEPHSLAPAAEQRSQPEVTEADEGDTEEELDEPEVEENDGDDEPTEARLAEQMSEAKRARGRPKGARSKRALKLSRFGIPYPSLPTGVVKKLATTYARSAGYGKAKISKDTLEAIMQASDWFFEQVSEDLSAYARHANRKTIDESDITTLMKRQRQINSSTTPFSLAQRYLPRELLQDIRMSLPTKPQPTYSRHLERVREEDE